MWPLLFLLEANSQLKKAYPAHHSHVIGCLQPLRMYLLQKYMALTLRVHKGNVKKLLCQNHLWLPRLQLPL